MAPTRSRARVFAISAVSTLLLAATAYGVGVAVAHSSSAGPELGPRIARPAQQASDDNTDGPAPQTPTSTPTGVSTGSTDDDVDKPTPPRIVLRPGDKGEQVRDQQQRLFQLEW